jgi:hypothetical protein
VVIEGGGGGRDDDDANVLLFELLVNGCAS